MTCRALANDVPPPDVKLGLTEIVMLARFGTNLAPSHPLARADILLS